MKNIFLLPTEEKSRLIIQNGNRLILGVSDYSIIENRQNIYITNSEEIKEGDWYFDGTDLVHKKTKYNDALVNGNKQAKKIILTTDPQLIADGVQAIDDEFLEWFVKNQSCEEVEVKLHKKICEFTFKGVYTYKIKNHKEEPKQNEIVINHFDEQYIKIDLYDSNDNFIGKLDRNQYIDVRIQAVKKNIEGLYVVYPNGKKGFINHETGEISYFPELLWETALRLSRELMSYNQDKRRTVELRGNIKFSTKTEQVENQNLRLDNKSGYKGVCYHKLNKKYGATITINKSKVFLGYYDTSLEAALVYDNYVLKNNLNRKTNL